MKLHLDKKTFKQLLNKIGKENQFDLDILEKDYYVCCILKDLALNQDKLKAYFKGGTAVYKILEETRRFSEDIDLTIEYDEKESKSQNTKRREKATFNYNIEGLTLDKEKSEKQGMTSTAAYIYNSIFDISSQPLYRAGIIKVESTSFTVSEPFKEYVVIPLIYKLANSSEREILTKRFEVSPINIKIIRLERMFVDKIFAAEFYYIREDYAEAAKHIYDICILIENSDIQQFLTNKSEFEKIIQFKRKEEKIRAGGIDSEIKLNNFKYLEMSFNPDFLKEFERMQNKYVFKSEYKIKIEECKPKLVKLKDKLEKYNF